MDVVASYSTKSDAHGSAGAIVGASMHPQHVLCFWRGTRGEEVEPAATHLSRTIAGIMATEIRSRRGGAVGETRGRGRR